MILRVRGAWIRLKFRRWEFRKQGFRRWEFRKAGKPPTPGLFPRQRFQSQGFRSQGFRKQEFRSYPEGRARQIDVSRQKLSPHCLEAIFDSQLPSPKLSPKMPPKLSLPHKRGLFILFQKWPRGEGNCKTSERQKIVSRQFEFLPRDINLSLLAHWVGIPKRADSRPPFGQDFYQTYARTRVERGFFSWPFLLQAKENKQKMLRNGTFCVPHVHHAGAKTCANCTSFAAM